MRIKKYDIVIFLLLLNIVVAVTPGYLPETVARYMGPIRALLMISVIPMLMASGVRLTWAGLLAFICSGYLFLLIPFSSFPLQTLDTVLRVTISLMMLVLAYNFIRGDEARRRLAFIVPICLLLIIGNFFFAQIFGVGRSFYRGEGVHAGGGGVQQTYLIAYFLLFIPILGFFRGKAFRLSSWDIVIFLLALFPLVLIARRGAILGFLIGLALYLIITPRKGRLISIATAAVALGIVTMPIYLPHIEGVIEHRMREVDNPEQIGRVQEIFSGIRMLKEESVRHALIGSELFNYQALSGGRRSLHTDYATYLIGAGLIGFSLYFGIFLALFCDFSRRVGRIRNGFHVRELTAVFIAMLSAYAIISFSGQYYVVSSLTVFFTLMGSLLAYIEERIAEEESGTEASMELALGGERGEI